MENYPNKIVRAQIEDAEEILALQKRAFYRKAAELYHDNTIPPIVQTLENLKSEFQTKIFLKYVENGQIIGSVKAFEKDRICYIERLIVEPPQQKQGIGSKLLTAIENTFNEVDFYELGTGRQSIIDREFYMKRGYKPIGEKFIQKNLTFVILRKENNH